MIAVFQKNALHNLLATLKISNLIKWLAFYSVGQIISDDFINLSIIDLNYYLHILLLHFQLNLNINLHLNYYLYYYYCLLILNDQEVMH